MVGCLINSFTMESRPLALPFFRAAACFWSSSEVKGELNGIADWIFRSAASELFSVTLLSFFLNAQTVFQ